MKPVAMKLYPRRVFNTRWLKFTPAIWLIVLRILFISYRQKTLFVHLTHTQMHHIAPLLDINTMFHTEGILATWQDAERVNKM